MALQEVRNFAFARLRVAISTGGGGTAPVKLNLLGPADLRRLISKQKLHESILGADTLHYFLIFLFIIIV